MGCFKLFKMMMILATVGVLAAGCGSDSTGKTYPPGYVGPGGGGGGCPGCPPVTDPNPPINPSAGATVDFTPTSAAVLSQYTGWSVNIPSETKVTINLMKYGTYTRAAGGYDYGFGGYVTVSFKDNGVAYQDKFDSLVNSSGVVETNSKNHKYNLLSIDYPELGGAVGYHGFFEDMWGAVIIVIDQMNDLGDGQGPTTANGSIYFKNFEYQPGPLSPTSCWFVSAGPYDCRTWKKGDNVETKRSIYPEGNYTKLGTFMNLDMKKAFNNQL